VNFDAIRRRVERSEQLVEGRVQQAGVRAHALKATWRASWTPTRIILAGLAAGFLVGRADPTRALRQLGSGGRWIQMIGALSGLFASLQSSVAAATAGKAADHAGQAADHADEAATAAQEAAPGAPPPQADAARAAQPAPPDDRRRPDPTWDSRPSPAEAATELSER